MAYGIEANSDGQWAAEHATAGKSAAFLDGFSDGSQWDLDGYDSLGSAAEADDFDAATINAGCTDFATAWGVVRPRGGEETPEWSEACEEYNDGVRAAIRVRIAESA